MNEPQSFSDMVQRLAGDADYRQALTEQLEARDVDAVTMERLITYARGRQTTMGQAMARRVLTDAGVSWESL